MITFNPRIRLATLVALLVVLNSTIAFSQVVTGSILGRVTDSTGAVVPGATVQIQNGETGFSRTEQTDSEGRYLSRNLPLGSYSVTVQQSGFQTQVRRGISLTVASEVVVNVELAVGNVQEKVEVTAEAPLIETTNATVSGLVSQDQMRDLPLNGRSVDTLALLSPGVFANRTTSRNSAVGVGIHLSVNGARPDSMLYLLDGTMVNDATNNGHGSAAGQALGVEGILEFRVLTHSFSAEYGHNAGGVISAVTRAGTNEFHGSVYEFVRNNIFDARNFFNPGALPAFRRNQFGAAAGGRIIKDRLFFFANYEGLRQRQGNTIIATVPDVNARKGLVPDASGRLQPVILNPVAVPYVNLYPLPNGLNQGDGTAQYLFNFSAPATEDYSMERMDYRMSDKDSFYGRYVFDPSQSTAVEPVPIFVTPIVGTAHLAVLSETHIFSGASLNEFRSAFNRTTPGQDSNPIQPLAPSLSFVPGLPFGTIQYGAANDISKGQLSTLGSAAGGKQAWWQNLFQESDTFSTVRGAHSLKFGVDVQRTQLNITYSNSARGAYTFGGLASLLAGQPSQLRLLVTNSHSSGRRGFRRILFGGFVQDDYRLRPNLTLNLGLRYEAFTAPSEVNGMTGSLRNLTDVKNTPGPPFVPSKLNFAPRVGMAWDPTGSGKTSVRLGAGMFFNHIDGRSWFINATSNPDFLSSYQIANPPFPNALAASLPVNALQQNLRVQYHPDTPTIIHYNLEVQRQLAPTLSIRAGYVGSQGYHLTRLGELDTRTPQILPDGSKFFAATAPFINPNFASLQTILTDAHSNYNGLQAVLQKTVSAGLVFQASYTYSKALSEADQITAGQITSIPSTQMDPYDPGRDYSRSAYDQRHLLVWNASYQMPWDKRLNGRLAKATLGGWAINAIYSYGSGLPIDILTGFNNSRDGDSNNPDRPDLATGFSNDSIHGVTAGCQGIPAGQKLQTPQRWFDPCAFSLPAAGTYGNLGRLTVTAPGLFTVDFTLVKTTRLKEQKQLEFRAEFFNLLNHANFGLPINAVFNSSRIRSGNSGSITSTATDNRQIQLGLKLIF
jgi:carboxypeptidase family protein/TonB-dependent receptor-like protein